MLLCSAVEILAISLEPCLKEDITLLISSMTDAPISDCNSSAGCCMPKPDQFRNPSSGIDPVFNLSPNTCVIISLGPCINEDMKVTVRSISASSIFDRKSNAGSCLP